ncbi:hypothetical protein LPJ64_001287 [Coemansia asiatica]|uniref:RING-type domain-containing protein n=1 Tax=Coemansia asiatica TaxID=1052880 RepID=A0A9W7XPW5_9FUNG|nr:hypothetical protein LPJ64_001287 [Coemansia asiatica]
MGASLGAVDEESEDDSDEDNVNNDSSNSNSNSNSDRDRDRDSRGRYRDEDILGTNERGSDRSTDYGVSIPANGSIIASSIADESRARSQKAAATASIPLGAHVFECPICLDTIQEAFMTACGHSFCFRCISRHLLGRLTCPVCFQSLERDQIYPNFALNKLIAQSTGCAKSQLGYHASQQQQQQQSIQSLRQPSQRHQPSIVDQIRSAVENGDELDADDIDTLMMVLQQKRQSMRCYERQFEMATMRQFLLAAQAKKASEMEMLRKELLIVEEDLDYVSTQLDSFAQSSEAFRDCALSRSRTVFTCSKQSAAATASDNMQVPNAPTEDSSPTDMPRNKRVDEHFSDLESFYFDTRMRGVGEEGLDEFLETLSTFAKHERFKPVATLRYGDSTASTAIVASIEFDRDDEVFAVAGVTRKIKIYDYCNVIEQAETWNELTQQQQQLRRRRIDHQQDQQQQQQQQAQSEWWSRESEARSTADDGGAAASAGTALQYPVAEFTNRSKISCLSFNPYIKSQLSCSDYDGTVSLWDVSTGTATLTLGEHEKRAWSVDFSHVDPTRLCSGSDDGKVKIWTTNRRASVMTIEGKANVCCVRFNPLHGNILSFGSADHNVHCFDLRSPKQPLCVLRGHRKAVSYTRFLTPDKIVSASTDSSLKLWNLRTQECVRTFVGHSNEKNFVGLTTSAGDWIACGSENNTMYAYHHNLSHPAVTYKFGNCNPVTGIEQPEDDPSLFVSAVCWKNKSNTMLSANSQGIIKFLELV